MNFQLAGPGHSFKGAFAYYLHDKRPDPTGPHPGTAERVAWMEVLNLAHDDPAYVQGVMIATARNAEQIKRQAGIKATGRKATGGAVFAYSIQWHPENETIPDRAGMLEIARETLKILGAEDRQVAFIAHTDTPHPHVHIVINRVDPATGRVLVLHKNADKLDEWAAKYERDRGEIVSPNRDAKHEARKRRPQPAFTAAAKPAPAAPEPVKLAPANQPARPPAPIASASMPAQALRPKTSAALLFERQEELKAQHKKEWADLSAANKERRSAVYGERIDFKAIAADHRAQVRPRWSELGKMQAAERRGFLAREKRLFGIVRNAIDVVRNQQIRGVGDDRGFLTMAFAYTVNKQARRSAFDARQQDTKNQLAASLDTALQDRFTAAKAAQAQKLAEVRAVYNRDRAALITRQDLEKARVRDEWKRIYAERAVLQQAAERSRDRMTRQNGQNYRYGRRLDRATTPPIDSQEKAPGQTSPAPQQEKEPVKPDFLRASELPVANQPPVPTINVSLSVPTLAPSPTGDLPAINKRVHSVPDVDRSAQSAKPSPDTIRQPAQKAFTQQEPQAAPSREFWKKPAPANSSTPEKAAPPREFWKQAAAAGPEKLAPAKDATPARDFWKENAAEITGPSRSNARPDDHHKPRPRR